MRWPQRAKKVTITPEWWEGLFQEGQRPDITVAKGLPAGSRIIGATFDPMTRMTTLIFAHESWEPVYSVLEAPDVIVEWGRG